MCDVWTLGAVTYVSFLTALATSAMFAFMCVHVRESMCYIYVLSGLWIIYNVYVLLDQRIICNKYII